ncbi:hypothetical protein [Ruegeria arenilitoris]|uniref:hypothetical protein n=1 Tax=Ruegeria arenilitoris TaxID=1173585 RepID=UPI00147999F2|nr:hypothetical protein [Ruegeria arenilitoris]
MKAESSVDFDLPPDAILAGIGLLDRQSLCSLISILESVDLLSLIRQTTDSVAKSLQLSDADDAQRVRAATDALYCSSVSTPTLRHRLWYRISQGLSVSSETPYTTKSAHRSSAAIAVRTSERLSPELQRRRQNAALNLEAAGIVEKATAAASSIMETARNAVSTSDPLPFAEIASEEFFDFISDENTFEEITKITDLDTKEALGRARMQAQAAAAGGAGWAVFAGVVANSGFAPYILAAKASAVIPLVSGPGLVSLLAVIVNPATLLVGLGGLAWIGAGKSTSAARSQVAARLCAMLAMRGSQDTDFGVQKFIADMRSSANGKSTEFEHLDKSAKHRMRKRIAEIESTLGGPMPAPAGTPPKPWNESIYSAKESTDYADLVDAAAVATLTTGQLLWHAVAMDRNVLRAADFSRNINLDNPLAFAASAHEFAMRGAQISLRGYTAERLVMDQLVATGHDVVMPINSNMPGFDLLVDGCEIQVKCGETLSILTDHFAKYPGIPVIANSELAKRAWEQGEEWASLVTTLPGFDLSVVEGKVAKALDHALDLVDLDVLFFAFAVGLVRGGVEVWRGAIPLEDLPAWMLIDGVARGGLGLAGNTGGTAIGLLAIGPAGALILGPAFACAALMGTGTARDSIASLFMREWHQERKRLAAELHASLLSALERKIRTLSKRQSHLPSSVEEETKEVAIWMQRKGWDDVVSAIEEKAEISIPPSDEFETLALLVEASRLAPADTKVLIARGRLERHLQSRPSLNEAVFKSRLPQLPSYPFSYPKKG